MYIHSPEERKIAKNCVAFCSALRRVEQQLRSEENSDAIIDGVLQAAAEFYGASRASIVEAGLGAWRRHHHPRMVRRRRGASEGYTNLTNREISNLSYPS